MGPNRLWGVAALIPLIVAVGACGPAAKAGPVVAARVGDLEIIHPYLPDPASPSVAAVYLTVRNTGATPDRLVSATSPSAASAMLMTESGSMGTGTMGTGSMGTGSMGTGTMAALGSLSVPGHGTAVLVPGHDHLMLEDPAGMEVGEKVDVVLRFARAGTVTVKVPVVPLAAIVDNDGAP